MINWNDIQVEQKIAQERYEVIVQGRQLAHTRQQVDRTAYYPRFRDWLGNQIIAWGCQIKTNCQAA
jgi:hypothetical protein